MHTHIHTYILTYIHTLSKGTDAPVVGCSGVFRGGLRPAGSKSRIYYILNILRNGAQSQGCVEMWSPGVCGGGGTVDGCDLCEGHIAL